MRTAISPRLATRTLSNISGPYCLRCEPRGPADRRAGALRPRRRRALRVAVPRSCVLGDGDLLRGHDDGLVRRTARAPPRAHIAARVAPRSDRGQSARARGARHARRPACRPRVDGRGDRRARGAHHGATAGGDRARNRDRRTRPREGQDLGAGGCGGGGRVRRRGRLGHRRRVVVDARRGRPDVGVRSRLRAQRAGALPAARQRVARPRDSHQSSNRAQLRRYSRSWYSPSSISARTAQWQCPQYPSSSTAGAVLQRMHSSNMLGKRPGEGCGYGDWGSSGSQGAGAGFSASSANAARMAARSSSLGSGLISIFTDLQTKVRSRSGRSEVYVGLRIGAITALLALLPVGSAAASAHRAGSWALPEIRAVTGAGLMGTKSPDTFHPDAKLTNQALANLVFGLQQLLAPPAPVTPVAPVAPLPVTTTTDPTQTTTGTTTTTATDPTATVPVPTTTTVPATTTTVAAPAPVPPGHAPTVAHGAAAATMTELDAQLVDGVGLDAAASEFARGARAAGLAIPDRFGNEVVARLLGLRIDHPAAQDYLELLPDDPATRAEAAYSAAQLMHSSGWLVPVVQGLADTFSLPHYSTWQRRIIDAAVAHIGMPYV